VTLTSKATGSGVNYSVSYSAQTYDGNFPSPSYTASGDAGMYNGHDAVYSTVYDSGTLTIYANGHSDAVGFNNASTSNSIASALASAINADGAASVTASASGANVSLTAKTIGGSTNYTLSSARTYDSSHFASPSFVPSNPSALSGGTDTTYFYDAGTVSVTVNGYAKSVSYAQGSTKESIAIALAAAIAGDSSDPATAVDNNSNNVDTVSARAAGTAGNGYGFSAGSATTQGAHFASPSFTASASGSTLSGGVDNGGSLYDAGTYTVTLNGLAKQVSYGHGTGQNNTASDVATAVAAAFNADGTSSVTSASSGPIIYFTAKTAGASTNYAWSVSSSTTQTGFTGSSYSASSTSGSLANGVDASGSTNGVYSLTLAMNGNGNVHTATDSSNGSWTYTYDDFNRLKTAGQTGQAFSYDYDRYGNRWNQNVTAGTGPGPNYSFDANNHISGAGIVYDAAGNVTIDYYHSYAYDGENRVISVDGGAWTYVYGPDGQRIQKTSGSHIYSDFYNLSGHLVTEYVDSAAGWNRSEIYAGGTHVGTYIHSLNGTYFHHSDWLGHERATTDYAGARQSTCLNLPFGDGESCTHPEILNAWFTGDEHDTESNSEHTLYRQMSGTQGRWLSADPYAGSMNLTAPQTLNRYVYVMNNPGNLIDFKGLDAGGICGLENQINGICPGDRNASPDTANWESNFFSGSNCLLDGVPTPCAFVTEALGTTERTPTNLPANRLPGFFPGAVSGAAVNCPRQDSTPTCGGTAWETIKVNGYTTWSGWAPVFYFAPAGNGSGGYFTLSGPGSLSYTETDAQVSAGNFVDLNGKFGLNYRFGLLNQSGVWTFGTKDPMKSTDAVTLGFAQPGGGVCVASASKLSNSPIAPCP
jgi:RHS repeat-associated protein